MLLVRMRQFVHQDDREHRHRYDDDFDENEDSCREFFNGRSSLRQKRELTQRWNLRGLRQTLVQYSDDDEHGHHRVEAETYLINSFSTTWEAEKRYRVSREHFSLAEKQSEQNQQTDSTGRRDYQA